MKKREIAKKKVSYLDGKERKMKNLNRIIMVQDIVGTLIESVDAYEKYKVENSYAPMSGNIDRYHTRGSIRRRIVQARAELLKLEKKL